MYRSFYHTQQSTIKKPNQICFNIFVWYINANNEYMWVVHSIVTMFFSVIILTRIYAFLFKNFMNFSKHQKQHFRHLEGNRKITVRYMHLLVHRSQYNRGPKENNSCKHTTPANTYIRVNPRMSYLRKNLANLFSEPFSLWSRYSRATLIIWIMAMINDPNANDPKWYLKKNPTNCFKNRKHTCNNKAAKQCKRLYQKIS